MSYNKIMSILEKMPEDMKIRAKEALKDLGLSKIEKEEQEDLLYYKDEEDLIYLLSKYNKWCFTSKRKIDFILKSLSHMTGLNVYFDENKKSFIFDLSKEKNEKRKSIELTVLDLEALDEKYDFSPIVGRLNYANESQDFQITFLNTCSFSKLDLENLKDNIFNLNMPKETKKEVKKYHMVYDLDIGDKFTFEDEDSATIYQKINNSEYNPRIKNMTTGEESSVPAGTYIARVIFSF